MDSQLVRTIERGDDAEKKITGAAWRLLDRESRLWSLLTVSLELLGWRTDRAAVLADQSDTVWLADVVWR
jgi:hypothetical protein